MKVPFKLPPFSFAHYVRYVRRQPVHIQELHAFMFAFVITAIIACCVLYYNYGFWHDVYRKEEVQVVEPTTFGESLQGFMQEVSTRWHTLGESSKTLLQSTDVIQNVPADSADFGQ